MTDESRFESTLTGSSQPEDESRRLLGGEPMVGGRLGSYLLIEVLGQGGMGRVFRARDESLKRDVAIKVMLPEVARDEKLRRRFLREARAMAALDHPNVVRIHHVEDAGPVPFFVMPLLRGETLQQRLERERIVSVTEVIRIGRQTAEGLAHAHEHPLRLVHRDVKPLNLWLEEGSGDVKLLDFGLVRMDQESTHLTMPGQIFGTPDFMAPEQWAGGAVDHRCDQYQLGCVLYLLCTGKAARGRFRDPIHLNPAVGQDLSDLIVRLLAQESDDRYPNMREAAADLARVGVLLAAPSSFSKQPSPVAMPIQDAPPPSGQSTGRQADTREDSAPLPESFTNSIGMKFVLVKPGKFLMGSPASEAERGSDEHQHEATITKPFYLGIHPVTQGQWKAVMGNNPSSFSRAGRDKDQVKEVSDAELDLFPVEAVSWVEVQDFLKKLSGMSQEAETRREYRLPTEAEWEYSCRAGHWILETQDKHVLPFHFDQPSSSLSSMQANFNGNSPYGEADEGTYLKRPSRVGSYQPNRLGIFDVHGNVWEWCADWYGKEYYSGGPPRDPCGPSEGSARVLRGGSWYAAAAYCRAASRSGLLPGNRGNYLGFRVALGPPQEERPERSRSPSLS